MLVGQCKFKFKFVFNQLLIQKQLMGQTICTIAVNQIDETNQIRLVNIIKCQQCQVPRDQQLQIQLLQHNTNTKTAKKKIFTPPTSQSNPYYTQIIQQPHNQNAQNHKLYDKTSNKKTLPKQKIQYSEDSEDSEEKQLSDYEYNKLSNEQCNDQEKQKQKNQQNKLYQENQILRKNNKNLMKKNNLLKTERHHIKDSIKQQEQRQLFQEQTKKYELQRRQQISRIQIEKNTKQEENKKIQQQEKIKELERIEIQKKLKKEEEKIKRMERLLQKKQLKEKEQKQQMMNQIQLLNHRILEERMQKKKEMLEQQIEMQILEEEINKMKIKNQAFIKFISEQKNAKQQLIQEEDLYIKKEIKIKKTKNGENKFKVRTSIQIRNQNYQEIKKSEKSQSVFKHLDSAKIWQQIENIKQKSLEISHLLCDEIMNSPVTEVQLKASQTIKKSLKEKAALNPGSMENMICKVVEKLQKWGIPIVMSQHSTLQSQISLKILTQGFMERAVKVTETIADNDPSCPFIFDDLEDHEQFDTFCTFYKMKIAKETGLDSSRIFINCVTKGSIKVQWMTDDSDKLNASFSTQPQLEKRLKLHRFFQYFHLSPEDFDPQGNIQFKETKNVVQKRGGWPYYQPVKCKRYGLNVSTKYDNGDDQWLGMKGRPGEWAVAFHGVKAPKSFQPHLPKTLNLIMQGLKTNTMLKAFGGQAYQETIPKNRPRNQKVGVGIYVSPHIQEIFKDYIDKSDEYALVFQCRVNPKQIKVCSNQIFWVINDTKNIRPYGIVLIKNTVVRQYPSIDQQFKNIFSYKDYKNEIEKNLQSQ